MKESNRFVLFLAFLSVSITSWSQEIQVSGVVSDDNGLPLPGVNVIEEDVPNGTITDMNGAYTISVDADAVLIFSFVGYETLERAVDGETSINVQLEPDVGSLDEVIVVGYGTQRKRDLSGSVSVVDVEETQKVMSNSLAESIQGLVPGVTVRNNGNPGAGSQIEIRGAASFQNTSPLYVVDGMIADAGGPLMNTNDIESIQILKDASATAIYGSRAANGVVIITTKKGKEGPMRVNLSARYGVSKMPESYDMMNSNEYAQTQRQAFLNSGLTPPASVGEDDSFVPAYNTDWVDVVSRLGSQQNYSLGVSGGGENSSYLISASHYDHEGVIIGNDFNRSSFRVNSEGRRGRFTVGENFVINYSERNFPQGPGGGVYNVNPFYDMYQMLPVIPVQAEEYRTQQNPMGWGIGSEEAETYAFNIPAALNINPFESYTVKAVGNAFVNFEIFEWLDYKFNTGLEARFAQDRSLLKEGIWRFTQQRGPTNVSENRYTFSSFLFDHTLNFNKALGRHNFDGVIGYSSQETKSRGIGVTRLDLTEYGDGEYLEEISSSTGETSGTGSTDVHYRIQGFLGRLNYIFDERYQLTLTGRYDQDSRFSSRYNSKFFPAVAAAWNIHNESFFKSSSINQVKLRASYGELGIVTVGSWAYIPTINNNQRAIFGPSQTPFIGANQAQLTNTDLRWETRIMENIGVDISLFDNKLRSTIEWYNNVSDDALVNQVLPDYLGNLGGNPPVNAGAIQNTGFEFYLNYRDYDNEFKWGLGANLTTIENEVLSVGNQGEGINYIQTGISRSQEGRGIAEWYLIRTDGIFQNEQEVQNHVGSEGELIQPDAQPGDIRFVDLNNDGTINQDDRDFVGSPWPSLQAGLQFSSSYKNFDLNAQFTGVFGYTIYNDVRRTLDNYQNSNFRRGINPWTPENTNTTDPRLGEQAGDPALTDNARNDSDRWLEDGSYVRLRNIELAYNFPKKVLNELNIQNLRISANAQNFLTITDYTGPDPDVTGDGTHQRGVDRGNWPSDQVFSLGLQLNF